MVPLWGVSAYPDTSVPPQMDDSVTVLCHRPKNQYSFEICSDVCYGEAKTSRFIAREDRRL